MVSATATTNAERGGYTRVVALGAGDVLDSYRILAPLKNGGMARLYLARREGAAGFAKPVAIKVIHPHLADEPDFVARFIAEARLSASIVDPHVVHVEGLGHARDTLYIAMEYVHGLSLAEVLRDLKASGRRVSPATAAYIASRVALGLHAAHETTDASGTHLGIIHRDVSPQNILVGFTGHVKLIDFGVAKAFGNKGAGDAALYGKLAYMAPEQARGDELDRRADVYALGVVLWELLTHSRLFVADNDVAMLGKLVAPQVPSPRRHAADVSAELEAVVMKALAPAAEDRYPTAAHFARALAEAVPEIRSVEPETLGALLRAIAPDELAKRRALLAQVDTGEIALAEVRASLEKEPTTKVLLRPDEVLAALTLPVAPRESSVPAQKRGLRPAHALAALGLGTILALVAFTGVRALRASRAVPTTAEMTPTAAPSAVSSEIATPLTASSAPPAPPAKSAAPTPKSAPAVAPARKAAPRASSSASPRAPEEASCRLVDGVELCR